MLHLYDVIARIVTGFVIFYGLVSFFCMREQARHWRDIPEPDRSAREWRSEVGETPTRHTP